MLLFILGIILVLSILLNIKPLIVAIIMSLNVIIIIITALLYKRKADKDIDSKQER